MLNYVVDLKPQEFLPLSSQTLMVKEKVRSVLCSRCQGAAGPGVRIQVHPVPSVPEQAGAPADRQ